MEITRFWGLTPDSWERTSLKAKCFMSAHYREHHLRESHAAAKSKSVSERFAKKNDRK
jgi:hypothetical protein